MEMLRCVENYHSSLLEERGFAMYEGWDATLAADLVARSTEPEILRRTPDDHGRRFSDIEAAKRWHDGSHKRYVYSLYKTAELAGIIWYADRPSEIAQADWTFAIRLYEGVRGRGLSLPFLAASEYDFRAQSRSESNIWLSTEATNTVAIKLYEKAGYVKVRSEDDRMIMIKGKNEDTYGDI